MAIKELTKGQTDSLAEYAKKGIEWALCCDPIDEMEARDYGKRIIKWLGRDYRATIILDSPLAAYYAILMLASLDSKSMSAISCGMREGDAQTFSPAAPKVWEQVVGQVIEYMDKENKLQVGKWNYACVRDWTVDQIRDMIWLQGMKPIEVQIFNLAARVRDQVDERILYAVAEQIGLIKDQIKRQADIIGTFLRGQWLSGYIAWYRYYNDVLKLDLPSIWQIEDQIRFGWVYSLSNFIIVSKRPESINTNSSGLHCDSGPALRYADGFSIYALNGVSVPKWLAVKVGHEIDPCEFTTIENAEIRREFVRKVGIDRIARACGAVPLDKSGDYELLSIDLGGETGKWPYLKMLNPSIGVRHLEAVGKEITTVEQALRWRNQSDRVPEQLT